MMFKKQLKILLPIFSLALGLLSAGAAPVIESFSPAYGSVGEIIHILGSGFYPGTVAVKFNGVPASVFVGSAGNINATISTGTPLGPGPISVKVNGVEALSKTNFTVISPGPYIDSFSPNSGDSGTQVTITGAHFTAPAKVYFSGVLGTLRSQSDQEIIANPPNGVTTGPISVKVNNVTYTSVSNFYVAPIITGFSPVSGRSGTNVVIKGINFTGATAVKFNGLSATFFVTNNTTIGAIVPAGATRGPIRVETPALNVAITSSNFLVQPTVLGFTPGFGPVGSSITVTGANFNVGTTTVKFGGVAASAPSSVTANSLIVKVPAGATNAPITVTTADGSHTSSQIFYLPPMILNFAPTNSAPGTTIQINGANFVSATDVSFNGTPAAAFYVTNNTTIGAIVPSGVHTGFISVTTPAGTTNSNQLFYGVPIIDSFTPTHGLPGTNVTILGDNFQGVTSVKFNGTSAAFSTVDNGTLTAIVPTNSATGPISITGPAGTTSSAGSFVLDYTSDLGVTITAPESVLLSGLFTYVITITNNGPFTAPNVTLTNTLPGTVSLRSASKTQGTLVTGANPVTGNLGDIAPMATATVTLTVTPQITGEITDIATVSSGYADPVSTNNVSQVTTTVYVVPVLSIQKSSTNTVQLSWSVSLSDYTLQYSDDLSSTNNWTNDPAQPEFVGDQRIVTEPVSDTARFYRLKR
jgi:hypothetical protein